MQAKTFRATSLPALTRALDQATADDYQPTLAVVFCSVSQDPAAVRALLRARGLDVFGMTTAGELIEDEVLEGTIAVMLLNLRRETYAVFAAGIPAGGTMLTLARTAAAHAQAAFARPAIVVAASGIAINAEQIIAGILSGFPAGEPAPPLFGGLAGDDLQMLDTFVSGQDLTTSNGLATLVFDTDRVLIGGQATSGWDTLGVEKTVTRAEGNVLLELDGEPALDVFGKFFKFQTTSVNREEFMAVNFAQYPLQMRSQAGHTVLRSPMMADPARKALIFGGALPEGAVVRFSVPPGFDLVEKSAAELSALTAQVPEAEALLLFSCKARHLALGPLIGDESQNISNLWQSAPLLGLLTYGEIGATAGNPCDFHNATCSLVALAEKR